MNLSASNDDFELLESIRSSNLRNPNSSVASSLKSSSSNVFIPTSKPEDPSSYLAKYKLTEQIIKAATQCESLPQILELNLPGNSKVLRYRLRYIAGLSNLMNLRELNLSNNDIEKIDNLTSLKKLKVLNLSSNKITKIEGISSLKSLEVLNLTANLIDEIPSTISKSTNLLELYLGSNNISRKDQITYLKPLTRLTILDLSNNPISDTPDYPNCVTLALKKLQILDSRALQTRNSYSRNMNSDVSEYENKVCDTSNNNSRFLSGLDKSRLEHTPEQNRYSVRNSFEHRLLSTHSKLQKINFLNNQIQMAGEFKDSPDCKEEEERYGSLSNFNISDIQMDKDKSQASINEGQLKYSPAKENQKPRRGSRLSGTNFTVNENSLYSVSESGVDRSRMMPPSSAQSTSTNWDMKALQRQIHAPETLLHSHRNQSKDSLDLQMPSLQQDMMSARDLQSNREGTRMTLQAPEESGTRMYDRDDLMKSTKHQLELNSTGINPQTRILSSGNVLNMAIIGGNTSEFGNSEELMSQVVNLKKERENSQTNLKELSENIHRARKKVEGKIQEYHEHYFAMVRMKENVSSTMKTLNSIVLNLSNSKDLIKSSLKYQLLNQRSDLISKLQTYLDHMGEEADLHMRFFHLLNRISHPENEFRKSSVITSDDIEANMKSLGDKVDAVRHRLELLSLDILNNETNIKSQYNLLQKQPDQDDDFFRDNESIDNHFKQLRMKIYDIEKEEDLKVKSFKEIKTLIATIWKYQRALSAQFKPEEISKSLVNTNDELKPLSEIPLNTPNHRQSSQKKNHNLDPNNKENFDFPTLEAIYNDSATKIPEHPTLSGPFRKSHSNNILKKIVSPKNDKPERHDRVLNFSNVLNESDLSAAKKPFHALRSSINQQRNETPNRSMVSMVSMVSNLDSSNPLDLAEPGRIYLENPEKQLNRSKSISNVNLSQRLNMSRADQSYDHKNASPKPHLNSSKFNSSAKGNKTKKNSRTPDKSPVKEKTHHAMSTQTTWNPHEGENKLREVIAGKDKNISQLQEELNKSRHLVSKYEEEVINLNDKLAELRRVCDSEIAEIRFAFNQTQQISEQEKGILTKSFNNLAEICDKSKLRLDEIKHRISSFFENNRDTRNPMYWVCNAQAYTIEELMRENKSLSDSLKQFITLTPTPEMFQTIQGNLPQSQDQILMSGLKSMPTSDSKLPPSGQKKQTPTKDDRSPEPTQKSSTNRSDIMTTYQDTYRPFESYACRSQAENPILSTYRDRVRDSMLSIPRESETNRESNRETNRISTDIFRTRDTQIQEPNDHSQYAPSFKDVKPSTPQLPGATVSKSPSLSPIAKDRRTSVPALNLSGSSTPGSKSNSILPKPNNSTTSSTQDLFMKVRDFTFKKGISLKQLRGTESGANTERDETPTQEKNNEGKGKDFMAPKISTPQNCEQQPNEPATTKSAFTLNQLTFQKNSFHNSGSMQNLHKILFGCGANEMVSDDRRYHDYHSNESGKHLEEIPQADIECTPSGNRKNYAPKRYFSYSQIQTNPAVLSNLQENIALQIVENNKKNPEQALRKVSNNIQNYKTMKEGKSTMKRSQSIKDSRFFSSGKKEKPANTNSNNNNRPQVSPLKIQNVINSIQTSRNERSPMSSRSQSTLTNRNSLASSRQNSQRAAIDYNRVFRKPSEYRPDTEREIAPSVQNYVKEKRRVFDSPSLANLSQKFDIHSPYHPNYANSFVDPGHGHQTRDSIAKMSVNLSYISGANLSRMSQRNSFITNLPLDASCIERNASFH